MKTTKSVVAAVLIVLATGAEAQAPNYDLVVAEPYKVTWSTPFAGGWIEGHEPVTYGPYQSLNVCEDKELEFKTEGKKVVIGCHKAGPLSRLPRR